MGKESVKERIYVYGQLNHFAVHLEKKGNIVCTLNLTLVLFNQMLENSNDLAV